MLNGDVLTDLDLTAQIAQHERTGARATLALTPVEDPSAYGLVRTDARRRGHRVRREAVARPDRHEQHLRRRVRARALGARAARARAEPASIERDVFPRLVGEGLYGCVSRGLLARHRDARALPAGHVRHPRGDGRDGGRRAHGRPYLCVEKNVDNAGRIIPSALVESGCRIGAGARIGGRVVLERGVSVGENTTIERAVVMQGAEIGSHCTLNGCIVAGGVRIGDHCTIDGMSVLGEGVTLGAGNVVSNGARIFPGVDAARRGDPLLSGRVARRRRCRGGRLAPARPRRSSTCRRTCATRCGASTPPASSPSTPRAA